MNNKSEIFYILIALSIMATAWCYYWIGLYLIEVDNPLRSEYITGFAMSAYLSSPVWLGTVVIGMFRFRKLNKNEIFFATAPALLILGGFAGLAI